VWFAFLPQVAFHDARGARLVVPASHMALRLPRPVRAPSHTASNHPAARAGDEWITPAAAARRLAEEAAAPAVADGGAGAAQTDEWLQAAAALDRLVDGHTRTTVAFPGECVEKEGRAMGDEYPKRATNAASI